MRARAPSVGRQWGAVSAPLSLLLFSASDAFPARSSAQRAGPVRGLLQQLRRRHRRLPRPTPIRRLLNRLCRRRLPRPTPIRRLLNRLRRRLPRPTPIRRLLNRLRRRLPRLIPMRRLLRQRRSHLRRRLIKHRSGALPREASRSRRASRGRRPHRKQTNNKQKAIANGTADPTSPAMMEKLLLNRIFIN
jgi:hypothetical protein